LFVSVPMTDLTVDPDPTSDDERMVADSPSFSRTNSGGGLPLPSQSVMTFLIPCAFLAKRCRKHHLKVTQISMNNQDVHHLLMCCDQIRQTILYSPSTGSVLILKKPSLS